MATVNLKKREVECKIVYYGPGRCGKTTNLQYIFQNSRRYMIDDMVSIKTKGDLTLFFDFVPMGLGKIKGCEVRVQLYTVPGQVKYASTRKLVLKGADAVVFVADSMRVRHEHNIESIKDLAQNLKDYGLNILQFPLIMQWNKRDLADQGVPLMSVEEMNLRQRRHRHGRERHPQSGPRPDPQIRQEPGRLGMIPALRLPSPN